MNELKRLAEAKGRLMQLIPDGDKEEALGYIAEMLAMQAQSDIEEVEVCVPTKAIRNEVDLGACKLLDTTQGILFCAKNSLYTLIDPQQQSLCAELRYLMEHADKDFKDIENEEERSNLQITLQAWLYTLQAPIFTRLDGGLIFDLSAKLIDTFTEQYQQLVESGVLREETIEDSVKNAEFMETQNLQGDGEDQQEL